MGEIFRNILNASFQGGIVIAVVLVLRLLLKKAPRRYICLLWILAGLRLLIPFSIESELSLQPVSEPITREVWETQRDYGLAPIVQDQLVPPVQEEPDSGESPGIPYAPDAEPAVDYHLNWTAILPYLWLIPAVVLALYCVASYIRLKRRVREAVKLTEDTFESDRIDTAFILGYLVPRIYLPMGMEAADREMILEHERSHMKNGDHWVKLIGFIALAIHWFNPLVWVAYICLCRDIELACDERVIRDMDLKERKSYSAALLSCSANRSHFAACPVAFGEKPVRKRILAVLNYRKPGIWITAVAVLAVVVVAVCFLTNPMIDPLTLENWGVTMTAVESSATGVTVAFDLPEKTVGHFIFNMSEWTVQMESDGEWVDIPMLPQEEPDIPWNGKVSMLFPNEDVQRIALDWTTVYGEMPPGRYRVRGNLMLNQDGYGYKRDFYAAFSIGVVNRVASGEPFAAMGEAWAWCNDISIDAVENAYYYREYTYRVDEKTSRCQSTNGPFDEGRFTELLEVLNSLPEDVFTAKNIRNRPTITDLRTSFPAERGLSVTVTDGANSLIVVLRYYNNGIKDVLELYMTDDLDSDAGEYMDTVLCWDIADDDLLHIMQELMESPAVVS